ncbi:hypothetical protein JZ751_003999 [Albula glossodonta]|uniref:Uncharacterized protein n=1 Tax=Albula glossodonta TaxID=121402 RepID=A0A8T2P7V2_9TELE|nr:hypothetical protein JZ751_003999 [Albula glossodonta]
MTEGSLFSVISVAVWQADDLIVVRKGEACRESVRQFCPSDKGANGSLASLGEGLLGLGNVFNISVSLFLFTEKERERGREREGTDNAQEQGILGEFTFMPDGP